MWQGNLQRIITGCLGVFMASATTVSSAQAEMVYITSEDGYISQTGYTDGGECQDKYFQQCITVHPNCGGARIYVAPNIAKLLLYWNAQGTNYNIGPSKNGSPYCRTKDMSMFLK
jgi:hypothetical protein